jgi:hypothetical protein
MQPDFERAANFIWSNARLIDRLRFAHHFEKGEREPVLNALRPYQNADGGFGNALEPDIRAPVSQPQPVELALRILDEIDAFGDPMVQRACDYLVSITTSEGGVPFVLPMTSEYPRAPWWNTDANPPAAINPTAAIAGLIHKHGINHRWLESATEFCWRSIEQPAERGGYDYLAIFTFLEHVPDRSRARAAHEKLGRELLDSGTVTLDANAEGHVFLPLQFAPHADSPQRALFEEHTIERHLDGLIARQQPDGGWPIGWEPPRAAAVLEWRGYVTVGTLLTLRSYGRLSPAPQGERAGVRG